MIERRRDLSTFEFFENYLKKSKPVIIEGMLDRWPAMTKWNPQYLKDICGNQPVQIMANRNSDPNFEINCNQHKTDILFSDYVDIVTSTIGNDSYLVANNSFMETPAGRRLLQDIVIDRRYLDPSRTNNCIFFWFGPKGTVTPSHHDTINIFLSQVYGSKRFILVPKEEKHLVYNHIGVFSEVDFEKPDHLKHPLFTQATKIEFDLNPGETIFLPQGVWHAVRSLDVSISVSFTNFINV